MWDFLAPRVQAGVSTTIGDLLDQVRVDSGRAGPATRLPLALARQPPVDPRIEQILTSDRAAGYVADVLATAWQALLEPEWLNPAGHPGAGRGSTGPGS